MVVIMKGISLLFILSFVLIGCSGFIERIEGKLADAAQSAVSGNDTKLLHTENLYCDGQSTGAVARKYGSIEEVWTGYWGLCNALRSTTGDITIPPASTDQVQE